ncbi:MAG: ABC transporter ATP-binding protein [Eubacterium sp.]|nr:ABC transporter ATP-binding protein [Eubacterium sp.]
MITGTDLVKNFGELKALDELSFTVPTGSVYGLVGPNGSGKSTLIRHIMGIFKPDSGEVKIDGEDIFENPDVKEKIAYVPDEIYYLSDTNIKKMSRLYAGMYPRFDKERLSKLIDLFPELNENLLFRKMSKGMQKQAAMLLALSTHAEILVLDEPMDGLDPMARHTMWQIIMESVAGEGTTVFVSSHNLRELEDKCDHIGIVNHGKIIEENSLDELQEGLTKVTVAYEEEMELPDLGNGVEVIHDAVSGRMHTVIIKGNRDEIEDRIRETKPVFEEYQPLTLEEVFINELGGERDEIKNILF